MKIVVVGYGEMFCSLIAGILNSEHEIVGVFRHENLIYPPLIRFLHDFLCPGEERIFTKTLGLFDIKAKSVNSEKFIKAVKKVKADIIIVGSWSEKFSSETIQSPAIACVNTHPSLLPLFRGPNPYIQTILAGMAQSGITFHLMDTKYDNGKILHQAQVNISDEETGLSLKLKCCELARKEVINLLNNFDLKLRNAYSQNEEEASYQKQISLKESILDFQNETSFEISKRIRALTPWLKCHIAYKDEFFEFEKYRLYDSFENAEPGTIIKKSDKSVFIVCKDNKAVEFINIKLKRPFLGILSKIYLKFFVKINSKVI